MDILMVAAELSPYARGTGAADTIAELSRAVSQLGHDVTIALPRYPGFEEHGLLMARRLTAIELSGSHSVTVFDGQLASGVKIALFDAADLFAGSGVLGDGSDPTSEAERAGVLCRAAAALSEQRREAGRPFDVVHLHDWATAPTAYLLRRLREQNGAGTRVVLTVHDGFAAGFVDSDVLARFDMGPEAFDDDVCRVGERASLLKAGLTSADVVTVSSAAHATKISAPRSSELAEVFAALDLQTIRSGIDYGVFNPATDTALRSRYDAVVPAPRSGNKAALLEKLGLDPELSRPLVVAAGDLGEGGGLDVVAAAAPDLLSQDMTLVVAGTRGRTAASQAIVTALSNDELTSRDTYHFIEGCSPEELRRVLGAADLVITAAQDASLARWIRLAHRYGALVVCEGTGSASDAVVDCDSELETGTGFVYEDHDPVALRGAMGRALGACRHEGWSALVKRVMRADSSWDQPARRYVQIYRRAAA